VQLDNTTALTLKIVDNFAARVSYEVRHDTDPGDDADKTDTTAKASLVYGFGGGGN
jgi:putative salt-induced outer membrane protein